MSILQSLNFWVLARVTVLCLIISFPLWIRPYAVNGDSMETTLRKDDMILVDTLSLRLLGPHRGELILFRNPHRRTEGGHVEIDVKRVIGLPYETVHVRLDKIVIDRTCADPSAPAGQQISIQPQDGPCQTTYPANTLLGGGSLAGNGNEFDMYLGPRDYFVLGDNRRDSSDSRFFGAVQAENFVGRPLLRLLPLLQARLLIGVQ
jgi:signal peptidase I